MRPVSLFLLVVLLGCGGSTNAPRRGELAWVHEEQEPIVEVGPLLRFPDADTLERLASRHAMPGEAMDRVPAEATSSIVIPPHGTLGEPHESESALGLALAELVGQRPTLDTSAATACVANAIARVVARTGTLPDDVHERLIALTCGLPTPPAMTSTLRWRVSPRSDLARERARAVEELRRIVGSLPSGRHVVGASMAREGEHLAAVVSYGPVRGRFDEGQVLAPSGSGIVRGVVDGTADLVMGVITQGELGAAVCETTEVPLPRFELRCVLEGSDDAALVDVLVHRPGRATFDRLGSMLVRRSPEAVELSLPNVPPVDGDLPFEDALAELVQGVRARLGLPPLRRDEGSAAHVRTLAPALVAAAHANDVAAQEQLALGLAAGRGVDEGWVRFAQTVTAGRPGKVLPHRWLTFALLHANLRYALVDPSVDAFAVGARDESFTAAAVVTYRLYDEAEREADAAEIFRILTEARRAQGLPLPRRALSNALREEIRGVREGRPVSVAFRAALEGTSREWSRSVSGIAAETTDPRIWSPPEELMGPEAPIVDVAVEYRRPEGGDWGQMVVLLMVGA